MSAIPLQQVSELKNMVDALEQQLQTLMQIDGERRKQMLLLNQRIDNGDIPLEEAMAKAQQAVGFVPAPSAAPYDCRGISVCSGNRLGLGRIWSPDIFFPPKITERPGPKGGIE